MFWILSINVTGTKTIEDSDATPPLQKRLCSDNNSNSNQSVIKSSTPLSNHHRSKTSNNSISKPQQWNASLTPTKAKSFSGIASPPSADSRSSSRNIATSGSYNNSASPGAATTATNAPFLNSDCSNSSWAEMSSYIVGSYQMHPVTRDTKVLFILRWVANFSFEYVHPAIRDTHVLFVLWLLSKSHAHRDLLSSIVRSIGNFQQNTLKSLTLEPILLLDVTCVHRWNFIIRNWNLFRSFCLWRTSIIAGTFLKFQTCVKRDFRTYLFLRLFLSLLV